MNIIEQLEWRYATKKFDATKYLENDKLKVVTSAFNLTATSYGLQPVKLVVLKNKALQKKLVEHCMGQEQVAQASHILIFCIETNISKDYIENYFNRIKELRETSEDVLNPFKTFLINDFKEKPQESIELWATKQAYLTMGNLLTVCAIEGIDACPMEGFMPNKIDEVLDLQSKGVKSVLLMPIGYRADDDQFSTLKKVRKTIAESILEL